MLHNFSYESSVILKEAEKISIRMHSTFVGTEHLLISLITNDETIKKIFKEYNIHIKDLEKELLKINDSDNKVRKPIYTPMLKRVLISSNYINDNEKVVITPLTIMLALIENDNSLGMQILNKLDLPIKDIESKLLKELPQKTNNKKDLEVYKIGTSLLNKKLSCCVVNREKELTKIIKTLLKKEKSNPLLVGGAGVGKTALVEELARRISNKEVPKELENVEIINIEMSSLLAGTKYRGEFEERLEKMIQEVSATNSIILFIDEIHSMVNAGGSEGAISASDILKPYLARGTIRIIGSTTTEEYNEYIKKDKALNRRFDIINIEEPSLKDMENIIKKVLPYYEKHYNIIIPTTRINDLINYANTYIYGKNNPDKTINLLDNVCSKIKVDNSSKDYETNIKNLKQLKEEYLKKKEFNHALAISSKIKNKEKQKITMTKKDIETTIEEITKIKIKKPTQKELNSLKKNLRENTNIPPKQIETLITKIANNIHNFIITGNTKIIKDNIKYISNILERNLITIDLEEYNTYESLTNLIGKWQINENNYLLKKLLDYPYSIIFIENIEYASPSIIRMLKKSIEEEYFTNYKNDKIPLTHALVFFLSNSIPKNQIGFARTINKSINTIESIINYQEKEIIST